MKILHVLKTSSGGEWAVREVRELVRAGFEVHVAIPTPEGRTVKAWATTGAKIHIINLDFPTRAPWRIPNRMAIARKFIDDLKPDLIQSHFVSTTLLLRYALGKKHPTPRIFQVPGPLHLEHFIFRTWELSSAGSADYWIGSSDYIVNLYKKFGVPDYRVFRSYYGLDLPTEGARAKDFKLHETLGIPHDTVIVGNVSYIYAPKYYLGQTTGVKCHEDWIDAVAEVVKNRSNVIGVLVGGAWPGAENYEKKLKQRAIDKAGDRIRMMGNVSSELVHSIWSNIDLAVHIPRSENCGGVVEPLLAETPVIASEVGGLPEVVIENVTGNLVPARSPKILSRVISKILDELPEARLRAKKGEARVRELFDVRETALEVGSIYQKILGMKQK